MIIVKQAQRNAANVWPQVGGVVCVWQVAGGRRLALKRAFDTRRVCILHAAGEGRRTPRAVGEETRIRIRRIVGIVLYNPHPP